MVLTHVEHDQLPMNFLYRSYERPGENDMIEGSNIDTSSPLGNILLETNHNLYLLH
jgi:hypothetical protein